MEGLNAVMSRAGQSLIIVKMGGDWSSHLRFQEYKLYPEAYLK